jgi:hypothetical protein
MADGYTVQLAPGEGKTLAVAMAAVLQAWDAVPATWSPPTNTSPCATSKLMRRCTRCAAAPLRRSRRRWSGSSSGPPMPATSSTPRRRSCWPTSCATSCCWVAPQSPVQRRLWGMRGGGGGGQPVMRGLYAAIIDEADGVLIDEATTPLIIASPKANPLMVRATQAARELVDQMERGKHYTRAPAGRPGRAPDARGRGLAGGRGRPAARVLAHARPAREPDLHGAAGARRVPARPPLRRAAGRRGHRRREHRPADARPVVEPRHPPGDRGARGAGADRSVADRGAHDLPGFLPPLPRAVGRQRHAAGHRRRAVVHLRPAHAAAGAARHEPAAHGRAPRAPRRDAKLDGIVQECRGRAHAEGLPVLVGTRRILDSEAIAERWSRPASTARCSTPRSTRKRPRSWRGRARPVASRWPPTWPAAAPTSCWRPAWPMPAACRC